MKTRVTIDGVGKIGQHWTDYLTVQFLIEEDNDYVFEAKYKNEHYIIRMDRFSTKLGVATLDPNTFTPSLPAKIRFNGYNAHDAKKLAALDIQTKNILNPHGFVIAIKEYLEWNVDLPF
jgi:hypothetical protein